MWRVGEPGHQTLIRAVRKALRSRFPSAQELAYDNCNVFVIGYGPTERLSTAQSSAQRVTHYGSPGEDPGFRRHPRFCWSSRRRSSINFPEIF